MTNSFKIILILFAGILTGISFSQFSFEDCSDLEASHFTSTEIFNKNGNNNALATDGDIIEPIQFDLAPVMHGTVTDSVVSVDVYYIERKGKVKYFNSTDNTITEIGDFDVRAKIVGGATDYGLTGIALDPDFASNSHVFLWYAPRADDNGNQYEGGDWKRMRLSRFTLGLDKQIDMNSEKILIQLLGNTHDDWHAGGPMDFDNHGDLWVTIGNNSTDHNSGGTGSHLSQTDSTRSDEWGTSNTSSMRGSIIRIHPDDSPRGYSIPEGNFGEYWSAQFAASGDAVTAAEYADTSRVLPEIYTKGHRSNFSVDIHPTKRWLVWADVNPGGGDDEYNLTKAPMYGGYPYFYGNQKRTGSQMSQLGYEPDEDAPINQSPLKGLGVDLLPPALPGTINHSVDFDGFSGYGFNVAISGPIFVHQPNLKSQGQWPPHLNEHWITFNWGGNFRIHGLDENADIISTHDAGDGGIMNSVNLRNPINAEFGPDGALYIMNYDGHYNRGENPGLFRVAYTGPSCIVAVEPRGAQKYVAFRWSGGMLVDVSGSHSLTLFNASGRRVWSNLAAMTQTYDFKKLGAEIKLPRGVYAVQVELKNGERLTRRVPLL